jgi:hypothetical protein
MIDKMKKEAFFAKCIYGHGANVWYLVMNEKMEIQKIVWYNISVKTNAEQADLQARMNELMKKYAKDEMIYEKEKAEDLQLDIELMMKAYKQSITEHKKYEWPGGNKWPEGEPKPEKPPIKKPPKDE